MSFVCGIPLSLYRCICINMWKWVWLSGNVSHPSHNFLFFPVIVLLFQNKYEMFVSTSFRSYYPMEFTVVFPCRAYSPPFAWGCFEWFGTFDVSCFFQDSRDSWLESSIATGAFGIPAAYIACSTGSDVYYFYKPDGVCWMRRFAS
jgi:hypothetical protein